jgi:hypothetical protein
MRPRVPGRTLNLARSWGHRPSLTVTVNVAKVPGDLQGGDLTRWRGGRPSQGPANHVPSRRKAPCPAACRRTGGPVTCGFARRVRSSACDIWPKNETASITSCTLAITKRTLAQVRSGGQGQDRTADLPLFRWSGCPAQPHHAAGSGCPWLRKAGIGCPRCRHGCRQRPLGREQAVYGNHAAGSLRYGAN